MTDIVTTAPAPAASLAALIGHFGVDVEVWDRSFARELATSLAASADRLVLEPIERLGLLDVVVTFSLADQLSVVVTGHLPDTPGELTLRWREADLPHVGASLGAVAGVQRAPYLVCTLDYGPAGQQGVLRAAAGPIPAGQVVRVRALATVGQRREWRVRGLGVAASVPYDNLSLLPATTDP